MQLEQLAQGLTDHLGPQYLMRPRYRFAVPDANGISELDVDAAIFSSPIPSIQTAAIGFTTLTGVATENLNPAYAYLGAPLFVARSSHKISIYQFRGSPLAEKIAEESASGTQDQGEWLRSLVMDSELSPQLSLFTGGRDLLLQETRGALSKRIEALMNLVLSERQVDVADAFRISIRVLRRLSVRHLTNFTNFGRIA